MLIMGVGVGWGGMLTFMLRWWCYAGHGGWGGVGWDDHVTRMMLRWYTLIMGAGWGGMLTFMLRWWCYAGHGGWGGVGWDDHVTRMMLRWYTLIMGAGWGGVVKFMLRWWCYADHEGWAGVGWNVHVPALQKRCALQDAVLNITENSKASHLKLNEHINTIFLLLSIFSTGDEASWSIIIPSSP